MLKISQLGRSREEEKKQRIVQWYRSCESTWDHCPYHKGTIEERVNTRRAPPLVANVPFFYRFFLKDSFPKMVKSGAEEQSQLWRSVE